MIGILSQTSHIFAAGSAQESGGIAALGVDVKALLLQIITFVIVFWLLKKFALDKIVQTLEERRKTIDKGVELGIKMSEEKQRLSQEVAAVLQKARAEADKIMAAGHHEAGMLLKEAEASAARKADAMLADAHAKIEDDIESARRGLEKEVLQLVAEAAGVLLEKKIDAKQDAQLISRALEEARRA